MLKKIAVVLPIPWMIEISLVFSSDEREKLQKNRALGMNFFMEI